MAIPETHTTPADNPRRRLDYYASEVFEGIASPSQARKLRKKGALSVNGVVTADAVMIGPGDVLTFVPPPVKRALYKMDIPVAYEDDCMAVLVKPPGLKTAGNRRATLVNSLPHNLQDCVAPDALGWPHTVHRLDDRTGGLVMVAKSASAQVALGQALQERRVQKRYSAVVIGRLEGAGRVDLPVGERPAASRYLVRSHTPSERLGWLTSVDLWPETGRTHQLRQHMAALGHPILGDVQYSDGVDNLRHKGLHLWALQLDLMHPLTGEALRVRIDEPEKFETRRRWEARRWRWVREQGSPEADAPLES